MKISPEGIFFHFKSFFNIELLIKYYYYKILFLHLFH